MKRDMDLARQILFEIEKLPHGHDVIFQPEIERHSSDEISYHIMLLTQAAYIEGEETPDGWYAKTLTWQGHEFLDAAKDESRWNKAKKIVMDKGGAITFEMLKQLLLELMKSAVLGKHV
jgi:Hypothetical protein (DUF2513)